MADKNLYNKDSIQSLSPREHIQLRPGMYAGDTSNPNQLLLEVFSNALDEHNIGHGNKIIVQINEDKSCRVIDEAQGFPIDVLREDGKSVLEAAFSVLNTSGKFTDDGVYEGSSLGLNGAGLKLTTFLSSWLEVYSWQNGECERLRFEDGILVDREVNEWLDPASSSGTDIIFKPDIKYFKSDVTDIKWFEKFFNDICCLCNDLTIELNGEIIHHNSIEDIIPIKIKDNMEIIDNRFVIEDKDFKLAMTFTSAASINIMPYVNYGLTEQGPHITNMKSTITRVLNNWAKQNGLLKEKDKNLDGNAIQEGMLLVCNIVSRGVKYDAQVKTRISDLESDFSSTLGEQLEIWLDNNPEDATAIIEKALIARKAAEAAKKARAAVKAKTKAVQNKVKILNPDKLKDAEYLGEDSTLLIVEGLSAGASMAVARDVNKYGILMLRGKLINAFTNKEEKLEKNEEIQLLLKALNISPNSYDPEKLRYGKVAICVDSDADGHNIALLIMAALQHFCPNFIAEHRLCWLRSPLYIAKHKGKEQYFFSDKELEKAKKEKQVLGELQRNKGLGSLSAEQAKASMFGENQCMDVLEPDLNSILLLEDLMGTEVTKRKEYIFNNIDFSEVRE